jgi:hypothetical protein
MTQKILTELKKPIVLISTILILILLAFFSFSIFNNTDQDNNTDPASSPQSNSKTPNYITKTIESSPLQDTSTYTTISNSQIQADTREALTDYQNKIDETATLDLTNPSNPEIKNPSQTNGYTFLNTQEGGKMIKLTKQNKIIHIKNINNADWINDTTLIISAGKMTMSIPEDSSQKIETVITGEKGIYIYKTDTEQKTTIYPTKENQSKDQKTFSIKERNNSLLINTGFSVEKLDTEGNYQKTIYTHSNKEETIFFTGQNNIPDNQIEIGVNKGLNIDKKVLDI